jgi:hypothetical protein
VGEARTGSTAAYQVDAIRGIETVKAMSAELLARQGLFYYLATRRLALRREIGMVDKDRMFMSKSRGAGVEAPHDTR